SCDGPGQRGMGALGTPRTTARYVLTLRASDRVHQPRAARGRGGAAPPPDTRDERPRLRTPRCASPARRLLGGREPVIELLLDAGVDVNRPSPIEPLILVTPLCTARTKRHIKIEALLLSRGAKEDIFTHAFLGNMDRLRDDISRNPGTVQAIDPAVDALQVTP